MKAWIAEGQEWFQKRNHREQGLILLVGFAVLYLVNHLVLFRPLSLEMADISAKVSVLKSQNTAADQQIATIAAAINSPHFMKNIKEHKILQAKVDALQQRFLGLTPRVYSGDEFENVTNAFLKQQDPRVLLVSFKELPVLVFPPSNEVHKNLVMSLMKEVAYQHNIELTIQGYFFDNLDYVKRLEALPWSVYWDRLDYKVSDYPNAMAVIYAHILSTKKG